MGIILEFSMDLATIVIILFTTFFPSWVLKVLGRKNLKRISYLVCRQFLIFEDFEKFDRPS